MLGDCDEDTRWQCHVEDPVPRLATLLNLFKVLVEHLEGLILVVLTRNICAYRAELFQLFFDVFCRGLYVGFDSAEVLGVIHLRSSISDNLDVFGEELVAKLRWPLLSALLLNEADTGTVDLRGQIAQETSSSLQDHLKLRGRLSRCSL